MSLGTSTHQAMNEAVNAAVDKVRFFRESKNGLSSSGLSLLFPHREWSLQCPLETIDSVHATSLQPVLRKREITLVLSSLLVLPVLWQLLSFVYSITVAASDYADTFASFSNYGECVDIIAPVSPAKACPPMLVNVAFFFVVATIQGVNIKSTYKNGGYTVMSGE